MRRLVYFLAFAFLAVSCVEGISDQYESVVDSNGMVEKSFNASMDVQTKMTVGDAVDGSYPLLWTPDDEISVFPYVEGSNEVLNSGRFSTDIEAASESAVFTGLIDEADTYYAAYPYSSLHQWIPEEKAINARMYYSQYTQDYLRPFMVAEESDGTLSFKHICGFIKFTIPESVSDLYTVKFSAPNHSIAARFVKIYPESLTVGELTNPFSYVSLYTTDGTVIKPGTYYLYALPTVLESGFSLEFYSTDGLRYKKVTTKPTEIKRGKILNLGTISDVKFDYPISTCQQVAFEGVDGEYYRIKGEVQSVLNTKYGNWYIADETGVMYIYGTVNEQGNYYLNWEDLNLEPGDIVTVQGPKATYGENAQLVDANVVEIEKSRVKIQSVKGGVIPSTGGSIEVTLSIDGDEFEVEISEWAQSWLSVSNTTISGSEAVVTFEAIANDGISRATTLIFNVLNDGKKYRTFCNVEQDPYVCDATAAEINAAEDGMAFRVTGYVSKLQNSKYGNLYIKDHTGEVYVYGSHDRDGNRFDAFTTPVNEGDIITVSGIKNSYKGIPQMPNVTVENHTLVQDVSVSEFLSAEVSSNGYYRITGTACNILLSSDGAQNPYGNFDIMDETGTVYVYGLLSGWGGPKKEFQSLGINEGDTVTLVGRREEYKGTPQVGGAFYVSHVSSDDVVE